LRSGGTSRDMRAGRDLQLGIYLEALEQLFFPGQSIAGGGYYSLKGTGNRRNQGLYRKDLSAYTGIGDRAISNMSDDDWLQLRRVMLDRIWSFWDGMRAGRFPVSPTAPNQTCAHCDVSSVCRYEQHRIRGKQVTSRAEQVQ
jgi:PD-(D/E)XK nuclease superfamily